MKITDKLIGHTIRVTDSRTSSQDNVEIDGVDKTIQYAIMDISMYDEDALKHTDVIVEGLEDSKTLHFFEITESTGITTWTWITQEGNVKHTFVMKQDLNSSAWQPYAADYSKIYNNYVIGIWGIPNLESISNANYSINGKTSTLQEICQLMYDESTEKGINNFSLEVFSSDSRYTMKYEFSQKSQGYLIFTNKGVTGASTICLPRTHYIAFQPLPDHPDILIGSGIAPAITMSSGVGVSASTATELKFTFYWGDEESEHRVQGVINTLSLGNLENFKDDNAWTFIARHVVERGFLPVAYKTIYNEDRYTNYPMSYLSFEQISDDNDDDENYNIWLYRYNFVGNQMVKVQMLGNLGTGKLGWLVIQTSNRFHV